MSKQINSFNIAKYNKKLGKDVAIMKVGHHVDVFFGKDGWEPHARFAIKRTNRGAFLSQVSGDKLPQHIFQSVIKEVQ